MKNKNNPLSPHIQIYSWHISSLISISHRITGVINIIALTFISIWISSMLLGSTSYEFTKSILNSFFGKFIITGIINILAITLICLWISSLFLGETNYKYTSLFLNSFFGKFLIVGIIWSFSFQILSELRHLVMDLGYGFELKTTKITGFLVIFGSFGLTVFIYLLGRNLI